MGKIEDNQGVVIGKHKKTGEDYKVSWGGLYKGEPELQRKFYSFMDWFNGNDERGLPRHGIFSLTGRRTNSYVYDHPSLLHLCQTAFTNGVSTFYAAPFFEEMLELRKNPSGTSFNMLEFVHCHELDHKLRGHFGRLQQYRPSDANIFGDMRINLDLQAAFSDWQFPPGWAEKFIGFKSTDEADYGELSEEGIARVMIKKRNDNLTDKGIDPADATDAEMDSAMADVLGMPGDPSGDNDHTMTMEDFIDALSEDPELLEALGITPDMTDEQKAEMIEKEMQRAESDAAEARQIRNEHPDGDAMPGGHIEDSITTHFRAERTPKMTYKLAIEKLIHGDGMREAIIDDVQDDLYFVDPSLMGMNSEVYLPGSIAEREEHGTYIWIHDTSGSVYDDLAEELLSEMAGMFQQYDMTAAKFLLVSADTVARGTVIEINYDNYQTALKELVAYGRGGTDLTKGINTSVELAKEMYPELPIKGIIYSTDLGDIPPIREELPEELPPLVFLTTADYICDRFLSGVESYATVSALGWEEQVIDLTVETHSEFRDDLDFSVPAM